MCLLSKVEKRIIPTLARPPGLFPTLDSSVSGRQKVQPDSNSDLHENQFWVFCLLVLFLYVQLLILQLISISIRTTGLLLVPHIL